MCASEFEVKFRRAKKLDTLHRMVEKVKRERHLIHNRELSTYKVGADSYRKYGNRIAVEVLEAAHQREQEIVRQMEVERFTQGLTA